MNAPWFKHIGLHIGQIILQILPKLSIYQIKNT